MKAPADFDDTDYDYGGSNYSALKPESVVPDLSDEEMEELDGGDIFGTTLPRGAKILPCCLTQSNSRDIFFLS